MTKYIARFVALVAIALMGLMAVFGISAAGAQMSTTNCYQQIDTGMIYTGTSGPVALGDLASPEGCANTGVAFVTVYNNCSDFVASGEEVAEEHIIAASHEGNQLRLNGAAFAVEQASQGCIHSFQVALDGYTSVSAFVAQNSTTGFSSHVTIDVYWDALPELLVEDYFGVRFCDTAIVQNNGETVIVVDGIEVAPSDSFSKTYDADGNVTFDVVGEQSSEIIEMHDYRNEPEFNCNADGPAPIEVSLNAVIDCQGLIPDLTVQLFELVDEDVTVSVATSQGLIGTFVIPSGSYAESFSYGGTEMPEATWVSEAQEGKANSFLTEADPALCDSVDITGPVVQDPAPAEPVMLAITGPGRIAILVITGLLVVLFGALLLGLSRAAADPRDAVRA